MKKTVYKVKVVYDLEFDVDGIPPESSASIPQKGLKSLVYH